MPSASVHAPGGSDVYGDAQIHEETGASVSTKGTWYPDRTKATEKDPPLYLHISATTKEILQKAIDKVNELLSADMGPLVDDKRDRGRERVCSARSRFPAFAEVTNSANGRRKRSS